MGLHLNNRSSLENKPKQKISSVIRVIIDFYSNSWNNHLPQGCFTTVRSGKATTVTEQLPFNAWPLIIRFRLWIRLWITCLYMKQCIVLFIKTNPRITGKVCGMCWINIFSGYTYLFLLTRAMSSEKMRYIYLKFDAWKINTYFFVQLLKTNKPTNKPCGRYAHETESVKKTAV